MLATLGGILALLAGLVVLLIPLLVPELSRPRDAFWGALVLLLGLVLVTSAERLSGAPMLAVLCGGLLIGRLGTEVSLGRWRQLSSEEQQRFWAPERWQTSLGQLGAATTRLISLVVASVVGGAEWLKQRARPRPKVPAKRWVRREEPAAQTETPNDPPAQTAGDLPTETLAQAPADVPSELAPKAPSDPGGAPASQEAEPVATAEPEPEPPSQAQTGTVDPPEAPGEPADSTVPVVVEVSSFAEIDALLQQATEPEREPDAKAAPEAQAPAEAEGPPITP